MIAACKALLKRHWPALRLRTILLATLVIVAALPGFAAMFLRVYENTLVQQTEATLIAQGAAVAAAWQAGAGEPPAPSARRERPAIDLARMDTWPEAAMPAPSPPSAPTLGPGPAAAARLARDISLVTGARVALLDSRDAEVRPDARELADRAEVQDALAGRVVTALRARVGPYDPQPWSRAAAVRVVHARPVIVGGRVAGVVLLEQAPRDAFDGIWNDRWNIAVGVVAVFGALLLLAALLSRGIARPIEQLTRATRDVARGAVDVPPPPVTAAVEIRALYESFGAMADRIDRRTRYLRDFAAAISHEFKTPLTGIRGALELLDEHGGEMTEAERRSFLANAHAGTERLSLLTGRLLDLARADMAGPDAQARTDAAQVARLVAGEWGGAFKVEVAPVAGMPAAIPAEALATVLRTLAENSEQAGASRVMITLERAATDVLIDVADDGPGIPATDRERVFEPFFTGRRAAGGTGLGLPVARSLLAAAGGTIGFVDAPDGARFRIRVPGAS